jgi:hypothetical protein
MTRRLFVSFSGGRTSAYMLWRALQAYGGKLPDDHVVAFANTGKEREETLRFVHECGATLRITATGVDAGFRSQTVYDWCRSRAHRAIFPLKGQSQPGKRVLGIPTDQDIDHAVEPVEDVPEAEGAEPAPPRLRGPEDLRAFMEGRRGSE